MPLTQTAPYQGANYCEIRAISSTGLVGASLYIYNKIVDSSVAGIPSKGTCKITLTNKSWDTNLWAHLSSYVGDKEVTENKLTYEDNQIETIVSGIDTTKHFFVAYYQGNVSTTRPIYAGRGVYSGNTGDSKMVASNVGDFPIEITLVKGLQIVAPATAFISTLITIASAVTITTDSVGTLISATAP